MNKVYLDREAYEYLTEWSEEYRSTAKYCPYYFKRCEVILSGKPNHKLFIEAKKNGSYKYNFHNQNGIFATGYISFDASGEHDFNSSGKIKNTDNQEYHIEEMKVFLTAFVEANAFLWYGNIVDNKEYIASGKNDNNDKIITFRKYKDSLYAVNVGSHRSPSGVFSVRGHFRHYKKTGKIIWIDEYLKGTDD